jgi:precorrin-6B methylase 2
MLRKLYRIVRGAQPANLLNSFYGHDLTRATKKPIDKDGLPIPWFTYPAIQYIDQFDLSGKDIFEWGCGNSSLFFAERARHITSVEHDEEWYRQMAASRRKNQELVQVTLEEYPSAIKRFSSQFDIIIIDGQRRFDCAREAVGFLKPGGLIIVDNSDWFYASAAFLKDKLGLIQIDFHGFSPINDYTMTTSFLLSRDFDFPLKKGRQPLNPAGGLDHDEMEIIEKEDGQFGTQNHSWIKNGYR